MKPKPNRNLTLPWTPPREKASGNHLLPSNQATTEVKSNFADDFISKINCYYNNL